MGTWVAERKQNVINGGVSPDVTQDLELGPILFLVFINDLLDNIRGRVDTLFSTCIDWADFFRVKIFYFNIFWGFR